MAITDKELKLMFEDIGRNWKTFKEKYSGTVSDLEDRLDHVEGSLDGLGPRIGPPSQDSRQQKAFDRWCKTGDRSELLAKTVQEASGQGQELVPELIDSIIWKRAIELSPMVGRVRNMPADTSDVHITVTNPNSATSAWSAELAARTQQTEPNFVDRQPTHGELYAYYWASQWSIDDAMTNVADLLIETASMQFAKQLGDVILNGSGTNRPTGVFNAAPEATGDDASPARTTGALEYLAAGEAGGFDHNPSGSPASYGDDIFIDALLRLRSEYRRNAIWVLNSATLATVRKFKDVDGNPIWQPTMGSSVDFTDGFLLGKPVIANEDMPAVADLAFPVLIADLARLYTLVRIGGMRITRDEVTTPGTVKFYVRSRFGGIVVDDYAGKAIRTAVS